MGTMGNGRRASTSPPMAKVCFATFAVAVVVWYFRPAPDHCSLDSYDAATTTALDLKHCKLTSLSSSIARFHVLRKLDLGHNQLTDLPDNLPSSLQVVFCLNNAFTTIPAAVAALPALRMLSFKSNRLRDLGGATLLLPTSLKWLILTDNELTSLPESLGRLTGMRKLMLANNRLESLPSSMRAMAELGNGAAA